MEHKNYHQIWILSFGFMKQCILIIKIFLRIHPTHGFIPAAAEQEVGYTLDRSVYITGILDHYNKIIQIYPCKF